MLEDADLFGLIKAGAYADAYDRIAIESYSKLSKDLSISQIQQILWDAFYIDFCFCVIGGTKEPWLLDKDQAVFIIGHPDRFRGVALNIRHSILKG